MNLFDDRKLIYEILSTIRRNKMDLWRILGSVPFTFVHLLLVQDGNSRFMMISDCIVRNQDLIAICKGSYVAYACGFVCKDSYVVYACGPDRVGKWEWFWESKLRCKNDLANMT